MVGLTVQICTIRIIYKKTFQPSTCPKPEVYNLNMYIDIVRKRYIGPNKTSTSPSVFGELFGHNRSKSKSFWFNLHVVIMFRILLSSLRPIPWISLKRSVISLTLGLQPVIILKLKQFICHWRSVLPFIARPVGSELKASLTPELGRK